MYHEFLSLVSDVMEQFALHSDTKSYKMLPTHFFNASSSSFSFPIKNFVIFDQLILLSSVPNLDFHKFSPQ